MEGQFNVDRGSGTTMQQSYKAIPDLEPNQPSPPSHFASQLTRLLGDDAEPDPLFFEESWTVGVPAAVESWRHRQQRQADSEHKFSPLPELHNLSSQMFMQQREGYAQHFPSAHAAGIAASQYAGSPMPAPKASAAQPAAQTHSQPSQQSETFADAQETTCPMTLHRACALLGVTATSSLEQIKSAYRRMVSQWHPDRLERGTDDARRRATEQMSAINSAYSLLRNGLQHEAA